jgi:hypothetical protein
MTNILSLYKTAKQLRGDFVSRWTSCKKYTTPSTSDDMATLFDSTASDAAEMLANNLYSIITPPESNWLTLTNDDVNSDAEQIATNELQRHLNNSNFYTTIHQCYQDLVICGTACLLFSENPIGSSSAFNFQSISIFDISILRSASDNISAVFYESSMSAAALSERYPSFTFPNNMKDSIKTNPEQQIKIITSVIEKDGNWEMTTFADLTGKLENNILETGKFKTNPFIIFRWSASTNELYGISPTMRALPDIKTANKVVELILKNASISVSGIWQADDDGVINLSNINLTPGAIIPKAVGSSGLTPLRAAADFDVSQLVLGDLRARIKTAMLGDKISAISDKIMTATEVLTRNIELMRILGAAYGRIFFEMITPLVKRGIAILSRRGTIDEMTIGEKTQIRCQNPIAEVSKTQSIQNILNFTKTATDMGMGDMIDNVAAFKYIADTMQIPTEILKV